MNFGAAIEAAKRGARIARAGWNGKGMFVWINKGAIHDPHLINVYVNNEVVGYEFSFSAMSGISADLFEPGDKSITTRLPNLNMRAADGSTVTGWLASQTDILAEDWQVLADVLAERVADQVAAAGSIHGAVTPAGWRN